MRTLLRFEFTQRQLSAAFLLCVLTLGLFPATGCTVTAAQIESDINLVLTQASQIAVALGDSPLASEIQTAETALVKAEAAWKGGGVVADVISSLNILEIAVAAVPTIAAFSPEVDVIVAGIEFVLQNLPSTQTQAAALATPAVQAKLAARPSAVAQHKGNVTVKMSMMHPTPSGAEKALWNKAVAAHPAIGISAL